jgi:HD superfamily phosphodiesterase
MTRQCPGQNTQFWKPSDIFDIPCARCGGAVEMFKDDVYRHCPSCGTRVSNPKLTLGCAQWCQHAKECLGYDPRETARERSGGASLAERIIEEVRAEFGGDIRRIGHALAVYDRARDLLRSEAGDPRVVLAAALLHDIGIREAERKHGSAAPVFQEEEGPPIARRILEKLGVDEPTIVRVCRIVGNHHSAKCEETPEFRIVWDADLLVNMKDGGGISSQGAEGGVESLMKTRAGRELARVLFPPKGKE